MYPICLMFINIWSNSSHDSCRDFACINNSCVKKIRKSFNYADHLIQFQISSVINFILFHFSIHIFKKIKVIESSFQLIHSVR